MMYSKDRSATRPDPRCTGFIDQTLGTDLTGFYEQRQEDTAEQREAIAAGAEEFRQNQPEAVKVVTGAVRWHR